MEGKRFQKREAIFSYVRGSREHPSAETVYARLKPAYPDLSLGTVYRNLALFKRQGRIASLGAVDGVERFDGDVSPHAHFLCVRCGRILDLPELRMPPELLDAVRSRTGGDVETGRMTFTGVCRDCLETMPEGGE